MNIIIITVRGATFADNLDQSPLSESSAAGKSHQSSGNLVGEEK